MIPYSAFKQIVLDNNIKIYPYQPGKRRIYSNDNISFDANIVAVRPSEFVLKQTEFNFSMTYKIEGILSVMGKEIPTHMFKHIHVIKNGNILLDYLYIDESTEEDIFSPYIKNVDIFSAGKAISVRDILMDELFITATPEQYAQACIDKMEGEAFLKVFNFYNEKPNVNEISIPNVDIDIDYLKSIGLTNNGFNPKSSFVKKTTEPPVKVSIKSFSNVPSVNSVLKKMDGGKSLTPSEVLVHKCIETYNSLPKSYSVENATMHIDLYVQGIKSKIDKATDIIRGTNYSVVYKGYDFGTDFLNCDIGNYEVAISLNKGYENNERNFERNDDN